jgi:hypothetical protein
MRETADCQRPAGRTRGRPSFNTLNEPGAPVGIYTENRLLMDGYTRLTETCLQRSGLRMVTIWDQAAFQNHRGGWRPGFHRKNIGGGDLWKQGPAIDTFRSPARIPDPRLTGAELTSGTSSRTDGGNPALRDFKSATTGAPLDPTRPITCGAGTGPAPGARIWGALTANVACLHS